MLFRIKLENCLGISIVAFVVTFSLCVIFVPASGASGYSVSDSESDRRHKLLNGESRHADKQLSTKEQEVTACKDCDKGLTHKKYKKKDVDSHGGGRNKEYLKSHEGLKFGPTTSAPLEVHGGGFVTAKESSSGPRANQQTGSRDRIRQINRRHPHETKQTSNKQHPHETKQTSNKQHPHETKQTSNKQHSHETKQTSNKQHPHETKQTSNKQHSHETKQTSNKQHPQETKQTSNKRHLHETKQTSNKQHPHETKQTSNKQHSHETKQTSNKQHPQETKQTSNKRHLHETKQTSNKQHPQETKQTSNKQHPQETKQTSNKQHSHETKQTSNKQQPHETTQPLHLQNKSVSSGQLSTLTTEEKLERLSNTRRARRKLNNNGEDRSQSGPRALPNTPGRSAGDAERAKKTEEGKQTILRKNTMDSFNEQTTKTFSNDPVELLPTKNSKTREPNENDRPHIQGITINVFRSGTDDEKIKSFLSTRKLNAKSTQVKSQRNGGDVSFRVAFLKSNAATSTPKTTEKKTEEGKTILDNQRDETIKGFNREISKGLERDVTLVSDGFMDDLGAASRSDIDHAGTAKRRDSLRGNRIVRPSAADRLEQQISPDLNRSYRELMDHLHGILQTFLQSLERINSYHKEIFNVTRYDIMIGAREIAAKYNQANRLIHAGVRSATQFTREVMLKYINKKDDTVDDGLQDARVDLLESKIEERNFQPQLHRATEEKRNVEEKIKNINLLMMKSKQGESRLKQVRELFSSNYDRPIIRDLHDYLNISIFRLNAGLRMSHKLRELKRFKFYLDNLKNVIAETKNMMINSADEIRKGHSQVQANKDMYNKWLQEERRFRGAPRGRRLSIPSEAFKRQQDLASQAKSHTYTLQSQRNIIYSLLDGPIHAAKTFLARNSKNATQHGLPYLTRDLQLGMENMHSSLDLLRAHVGGKVKIQATKMCRPHIEGSGIPDNSDDEDLCEEEGSGYENSVDEKVFVANNEDFTFVGEPVDTGRYPVNSVKQLGVDLTHFTFGLLRNSQKIYDRTLSLQQFLAGLQKLKSRTELSVSDLEESTNSQKDFILHLENRGRDFKEIRNKIQEISHKVADLKSFKLEEYVEKAKQAVEKTNKRSQGNGRLHKYRTSPKKSNKTVDGTERLTNVEDGFNYSDLLKKGQEILGNHADIKLIQSMAVENCGRIGNHFTHIRNNMTLLRQKVEKARQMLATLQLSMSKSGSGYITLPVAPAQPETTASLTTSIRVCIKPKSLDGTLLLVTGNSSASYSVTLDDGKLAVTAYNNKYDDLGSVTIDQVLVTEQWYTIEIQRTGETLSVTAALQSEDTRKYSKVIDSLHLLQPLPLMAYIGGVPPHLGIGGASWEGCVGELTVNGRVVTLFSSSSEGTKSSLCTDHCISDEQKLSVVFNGNGFAHFVRPARERISLVTIMFRTHQEAASLLSVSNKNQRFYLSVVLVNGGLKIESSSLNEKVVLLSLNSSLNDGLSHFLRVVYKGSRTYPELDGNREAFSVERTSPQVLTEVLDGVLLGAFVSNARQFMNTSYRPLIGCLRDIIINDERLLLPDAADVYNTFYGDCRASSRDVWHSCWQWTDHSKLLSLGVVENSNRISLLVSNDAHGPLIHFTKEDKFDIEVTMTKMGIDVSSDDSESVLIRPEQDSSIFVLVTIVDEGNTVRVRAWDQSVDFSYGGLWGYVSKDLTKPHTVVIGEARGGEDRVFAGSISQFAIEDRFYDLSQSRSFLNLLPCKRPVEDIPPVPKAKVMETFSCV